MKKNSLFILVAVIIVVLVGVGSVNQWQIVPVFVIVITFAALIGAWWIDSSYYPYILYILAVTSLWQVSMLGTYVVGTDVHLELYTAEKALEGLLPAFDGYNTLSSSSLLMYIAPGLQKIGIPIIWQFKLIYPALYAVVPVLLYIVFRRVLDDKYAFIAALFLIITPMYSIGMTSGVRSMVSQTCWIVALYAWFYVRSNKIKIPVIVGTIGLAVSAHYAFTGMALLITIGASLVSLIILISRRRFVTYPLLALVVVILTMTLWYGCLGKGRLLEYYIEIGSNLKSMLVVSFGGNEEASITSPSIRDGVTEKSIDELIVKYDEYTNPQNITGTYLDKQPQSY